MGKFIAVFIIIILICAVVFLCGAFISIVKTGEGITLSFNLGETSSKILEESYSIEDFDDLKMDYKYGNIFIKHSEDNNVKVIAYGKETDEIKSVIEDKKLFIEDFQSQKQEFDFNIKRKIEIYLPKQFSNTIDCESKAGNIEIDDFENSTLNIKTNAGNIHIGNAKLANIKSDAGNVNVNKVPDLKVETNAGNIQAEEIVSKCNVKTNAGNIHISKLLVTETSNIETDMGNISITETSDICIETKNELGKVKVEHNNKNSNIKVYIKTSFGNINVK